MSGRKRSAASTPPRAYKTMRYSQPAWSGRRRSAASYRKPYKGNGSTRRAGYYGRFGTSSRKSARAPELKFFDTAVNFSYDLTAEVPATGQLLLIPAGTSESTRIGRKILLKSIQVKCMNTLVAGTTAQDQVDFYLVQDTQCNGAAAAWGDVFTGTVAGLGLRNMANSSRFKVLYHHQAKLLSGAGVAGAYSGDHEFFETFIKCNIPIEFASGAGGAVTDLKSNNLFIMAGDVTLADDTTTCVGNVRVKYTDV